MADRIFMGRRLSAQLLSTAALALALTATAPRAQEICDEAMAPQPENCRRENASVVVDMPVGENVEMISGAGNLGDAGFSISMDDERLEGPRSPADETRSVDMRAAATGVDLRYDGLVLQRYLNVATQDLRAGFRGGDAITFRTSSNYPAWISRAEIRIIDRSVRGKPVVAVLPARPNGTTGWQMPATGSGELSYVLRVYDDAGRYDETIPLDLNRTTREFPTHETTFPVVAAGEAEDRTRIRLIPQLGGSVTVSGTAQPGGTVTVMGEEIPVDAAGNFVVNRNLPAGDHQVAVDIGGERIVRDVYIPASEWFYVGIADVTFGRRLQDELSEADPDYEANYADGRLAGYAKGRTQNGYDITLSIDTGEGELEDAFRRLDEKDPMHVLERLNPEDMYPTYGDDSYAYDDAPSSGRFYARVAKGGSSLTWGDFRTEITGTEYLAQSRGLYGAQLEYASPTTAATGDPKVAAKLYAAQPDTLPQRDILRGTGGSMYFLSRQDINGGSETVGIEVVDPDTGRTIQRRSLAEGVDYEIDYLQGVIKLAEPLGSWVSDGALISQGNSGPYVANLVVQYEYTPTFGDIDGNSYGGRIETWATDNLRIGVTAMSETTGEADQNMGGVDLRYQFGKQSYIEAEADVTQGPGFGRAFSTNGGLTIASENNSDTQSAGALRFDSYLDFGDMGIKTPGTLEMYYERKDAGFSTITEDITANQTLAGFRTRFDATERLGFAIAGEYFDSDDGDSKDSASASAIYQIDPRWSVEVGLAYLNQTEIDDPEDSGRRTDGGVRLSYTPNDDWGVYVFGQKTIDAAGEIGDNDRIGVGGNYRFSEKLMVEGEVSGGDEGPGALARLTYSPTPDREFYMGYTLDPNRSETGYDLVGRDDGVLILGSKYRYNEHMASFGEQKWDLFGERRSLARSYGVEYTPNALWTYTGAMEIGQVDDPVNGDFDRQAISGGVAYVNSDQQAAKLRLEYRTDDGEGTSQDGQSWAAIGGYEYKVNDDWRFIAGLNALISNSDESSFLNGEYVRASAGYAYRPVLNDRLNMLARYTYLRDLPGADQVDAEGNDDGPQQISHVISIDANYDLSPKFTLGGKYGFRMSEVADRGTDDFDRQRAHLGILRLDWRVVHKWDALFEGRVLYTEETSMTETGALAAIYRQINNNAKVGIGYEWGNVSQSETDIDYTGQGIFLNIVASY